MSGAFPWSTMQLIWVPAQGVYPPLEEHALRFAGKREGWLRNMIARRQEDKKQIGLLFGS